MKLKRRFQFFFGILFGLVSFSMLLGAAIQVSHGASPATLLIALFPLLIGAIPVTMFELQIRSLEKARARVLSNVEAVGQRLFDTPASARPGYDMTVTAGALGALASAAEADAAYTTDGKYGGAHVSIASHASTLGRQMGEFHHTYSHVVVDLLGMVKRFRLSREGIGTKLATVAGLVKDAKVGEETFDAMFNVDVEDAELARVVLDDSIRKRLTDLQSKVHLVSSEFGTGGMNVVVTSHGLALRWPGDITPELATFVRDLLLDMRERMLAYENRKATRVAVASEAAGYRIASDVSEAEQSATEEEAAREQSLHEG